MGGDELDLAAMAQALTDSGQYKVLRKLSPRSTINLPDGSPTRVGLFLDVETTGLDPEHDEVIELAMLPFTYGTDGRIFELLEPFQGLNQPSKPIPPEITRITGIDDGMVEGQRLDIAAVEAVVRQAALILAHNASFDRQFAERLTPAFAAKPWACSMSQIEWTEEGHEGTKLAYLGVGAGFYYDGHRALHDCQAAVELLASPLPASGALAMTKLLERARRSGSRVWAQNAPYDLRSVLKERGYRWNGEGNPNPKGWYIDVDQDQVDAELAFLRTEIYQRDVELLVHPITPYNRFSSRVTSRD